MYFPKLCIWSIAVIRLFCWMCIRSLSTHTFFDPTSFSSSSSSSSSPSPSHPPPLILLIRLLLSFSFSSSSSHPPHPPPPYPPHCYSVGCMCVHRAVWMVSREPWMLETTNRCASCLKSVVWSGNSCDVSNVCITWMSVLVCRCICLCIVCFQCLHV